MFHNIGIIERPIRFALGFYLFYLAMTAPVSPLAQAVLLILGCVGLVTGAVGYCLIYQALGVSTRRKSS